MALIRLGDSAELPDCDESVTDWIGDYRVGETMGEAFDSACGRMILARVKVVGRADPRESRLSKWRCSLTVA
jgi:hypothetical protein